MPLLTDVSNLFVGTANVDRLYVGTAVVWQRGNRNVFPIAAFGTGSTTMSGDVRSAVVTVSAGVASATGTGVAPFTAELQEDVFMTALGPIIATGNAYGPTVVIT